MSREIGIDIGTSSTRVYVKGEGRISNFPSIIALDSEGETLEIGVEAKKMLGRVPRNISVIKPISGGAVIDSERIAMILYEIFKKLDLLSLLNRPVAYVSMPSKLTEVEKSAIISAVYDAGAVKAVPLHNAVAGAIGADIDIKSQRGSMLVQMGGGYTEVSVFSMARPVLVRSDRIGGEDIDKAIIAYLADEGGFSIGELTAEKLKIKLGTALPIIDRGESVCYGRNLQARKVARVAVNSNYIYDAIRPTIDSIMSLIKTTIKETPSELANDIYEKGIVISGGTSLLAGFPEYATRELGIKVSLAKKPLNNVAIGVGKIIESGNDAVSMARMD